MRIASRAIKTMTAWGLSLLAAAPAGNGFAQAGQPAIFVANNGNCEGSVTSFTVNGDGSLNFVQKVITGSVPCGSGQTAPGLNAQAVAVSPNGRWMVTGHGTSSSTMEQLTFYEIFEDATFSILFTALTPDSPVDVLWLSDEYLAVTATPSGDDFVIIYHFDPVSKSIVQHFYQPVPYIFDMVYDRAHQLLFTRAGLSGVQPFRVNADYTITKLTAQPVATGIFFLGPGLSPDGTKLYFGGGISSANGQSSRWIGGLNVDTATGALSPMSGSPYLSPPSDGTSSPSPKEVDVSSDGEFAYVNHGGTGHIKGFAVAKDGALTPIDDSYFDVGGQGNSGNMSILDNRLYVTRKYSSPNDGVLALQINADGTLTQIESTYPTQGSLPWDIAVWPGPAIKCPADVAPLGGDGEVNVDDLLTIINAWGPCVDPDNCPADISPAGGNDVVDVDDLLEVIDGWGLCDSTIK